MSNRPARLATSVAFGVQGLVFASVLTRVPAIKDKFGFTDGELTVLLAVIPVIAGTGSVLADRLTTRLAGRGGSAAVLPWAAVAACLAAAAIGLASSRPLLFVALGCYGLAVGAVDATMNMQGVAVQARYGRTIMNGFHAVWSLAGITGALYTSVVAATLSVGASTSVVAAVGLLAIAAFGRWLLPVASTSGAAPAGSAVDAPAVPWRVLLPIGLVLGCVYVADSGVSNWSAVYLHDTLLASEGVAALAYAAYQTTALVGRVFGDRLVYRHGTALVVRCAVGVAVAGLLGVIAARSPWLAIAGFGVLGLGASVLVPLSFSAAGRLDDGRGSAIARVNLFNYAGFLIGAPLIGTVGAVAGLRWSWWAPMLLLGVVVVLAARLDPTPRAAPETADTPS